MMKFELEKFNRNVPDEELLRDLVAVEAILSAQGKNLTTSSYSELGSYSYKTLHNRFGSWNSAIRKAGLVPKKEMNVPIESLFDNMKIVWIAKGRQPVMSDMRVPPSQYSGSTYRARFGGWRKALEEFVVAFEHEQHELLGETSIELTKVSKRTSRDPSLSLRFFILKRDSFRCVTCGRSPATTAGLELQIDHILAWSKGGETIAENLQSLCFDCNNGKSAT